MSRNATVGHMNLDGRLSGHAIEREEDFEDDALTFYSQQLERRHERQVSKTAKAQHNGKQTRRMMR